MYYLKQFTRTAEQPVRIITLCQSDDYKLIEKLCIDVHLAVLRFPDLSGKYVSNRIYNGKKLVYELTVMSGLSPKNV